MPRHRLPDLNGKKCQDIGYPEKFFENITVEADSQKPPPNPLQGKPGEYVFLLRR